MDTQKVIALQLIKAALVGPEVAVLCNNQAKDLISDQSLMQDLGATEYISKEQSDEVWQLYTCLQLAAAVAMNVVSFEQFVSVVDTCASDVKGALAVTLADVVTTLN
jgi:hypothetical protein